ncbi:MAG: 16S rRNA (cytosine(967)-C(5))-methyltransferase RsmB [Deltaproteobacteria bacterium]|nr:16S rRNA (cytosine(967)-C(5))-methyltransferase RsmB [Deltaproteobacteria bacterium]MBW2661963.1 16S rRNA (cytosine(967)-C(5))-methyltransferase RsmB [Deltaproteobacteria bacterium]
MKHNPRKTALFVLNSLSKKHYTLDRILEDIQNKKLLLSRKDQALFYALVYGVLRWRGRLDWTINHFSKTSLQKIDPVILNILRLGLFQIIYLNRIPVSAAVNTSVEIAKFFASSHVAGFVNALLRKADREYKKIPFPDPAENLAYSLAVSKSFPEWMIKRWLNRFGLKETEALCDAINTIPPITVRTNRLKATRDDLSKSLASDVQQIENTTYSPDGIRFIKPNKSIPGIKAFKDGLFQVQDEAAQLVSCLLNPRPGDTVLDACAGLGGKAGHIAQMMKNTGRLLAMDNNANKLQQLESEMKRLGISIVTTCNYDLTVPFDRQFSYKGFSGFDHILLDAPCSGLGVLRRNPDAKWSMSENKLSSYKKRQVNFLNNLAQLVKPSGTLVYAVCSTEPEENEKVVKNFLNKHSEFAIKNKFEDLPINVYSLVNENRYLKTYPHINNMDGFFAVCFKRTT